MNMYSQIVKLLKKALYPMRTSLGRFMINPETVDRNGITYKAASLIAAEKIEGDYLEFGVYRGDSFIAAYRSIELAFKNSYTPGVWNSDRDCRERYAIWNKMRFFAFDSFQGLPSVKGLDVHSNDFVEGKYDCSHDEFRQNLQKAHIPTERITAVPGWFDESLTDKLIEKHRLETAAIVLIDSDLYESSKDVLNFITPLLAQGTVVIFDDWFCYRGNPGLGEQRACREWLEANPHLHLAEYHKEGPWRNSFIVSKLNGDPVDRDCGK